MNFDLSSLKEKQRKLDELKTKLKSEFFGLDNIIEKVVDSLYAWYVFPELITRPVVINLWGMTGVGKTQLVRRIVQILNFTDKFVEIQMDGISGGSYFHNSSISSILSDSSIEEGQQGILLLDEIQRFRTIDGEKNELKVERYQDIWMLLSDGKFSSDHSIFKEIENMILYQIFSKENDKHNSEVSEEDSPISNKEKISQDLKKFKIYPYEAMKLKKLLKVSEPIEEIMTWSTEILESKLHSMKSNRESWETDYSKLLIFISGNLDEAFSGASDVEDCDTDADIYHELTKKITSIEIKDALKSRFKPEQISRLGNNNIIYPSLSKDSYTKLIKSTCTKYILEMEKLSGIKFNLDEEVYKEIYDNSVYPTQGTRPVFSSIHRIFSTALTNIAIWALENNYPEIHIQIDIKESKLFGTYKDNKFSVPIELEIRKKKASTSLDFNTLVAVHEAGHALLYAILTKTAPKEVKINLASFKGGYVRHNDNEAKSKSQIRDFIKIALGGTIAEEIVFGSEFKTTGNYSDLMMATRLASDYVRVHGFDTTISHINSPFNNGVSWNTEIDITNIKIESLLKELKQEATDLLLSHQNIFKILIQEILTRKTIKPDEFCYLVEKHIIINKESNEIKNYNQLFTHFLNGSLPLQ